MSRTGQSLTPFMRGNVQLYTLKKEHNLQAVRNELTNCGLGEWFNDGTNYHDSSSY